MPNYRRAFIPGGCWFFTVNLLERRRTLLVDHIDSLRSVDRQDAPQVSFRDQRFRRVTEPPARDLDAAAGRCGFLHSLASYQDRLRQIIPEAGTTERNPPGAQ